MTEPVLPDSATPVRRTPTWTAATVPPALLDVHHTAVWAELVVEAGSVEFREVGGPGAPEDRVATVTPERPIVIVPDRRHRIAPSDDARFHVQFYAHAG